MNACRYVSSGKLLAFTYTTSDHRERSCLKCICVSVHQQPRCPTAPSVRNQSIL
ncbi:hypothetical protein L798_06810 [Zootermopsis nevadensis]|uniref:Uncharacterized protein n=1 Tax=Zootermopsis nevadensis TaxID=136037 RepID=A0A067RE22_ZOONE|nr:hypothetical protein L798_06810 [Zootermopsis nevadensis]